MDWNKATNIERIQMVCEEGIARNNKQLLRFEDGTHMHSFTLGTISAFEQVLSHVEVGTKETREDDKQFYVCDPKKNAECAKTICIHNPKAIGDLCSYTLEKEFEIDRPPVK